MQRKPRSRIRELREKAGYTQKQLAQKWGVSTVTVQHWETKSSKAYRMVGLFYFA